MALARLQYSIVESLLEVDPGIVLHGDTAIWRCYSGNRFSEDVDICATDAQVDKPGKLITWSLSKRNIKMDYPLRTSRAVNVLSNDARSKFEAMEFPGGLKPVRMEFRKSNGSKMVVNTLSVGDFIKEKIPTYEKRKYVRDLYDICHLTRVGGLSIKFKRMLSHFLSQLEKPTDEKKLRDLLCVCVAPNFETKVKGIKGSKRSIPDTSERSSLAQTFLCSNDLTS